MRDLSRKDLTVTNGISCMGCHDLGIRKAKDEIRAFTLKDRGFSKATRDAVEALYPVPERMDVILEEDTARFRQAMTRAGLDPTLKLNGIEMINALAAKYEATVDLQLAAAEFGLKAEAFRDAAAAGGQKALSLVRRLDQGLVPRDQFEADFAALVPNVTDDEALTAGSGHALDVARVGAGSKDVARSFDLSLTSDRNAYRQNDPAVFTVVSQEDCSLTLINVDAKGVGTVLFPNKFQPDNFIRARQEFRFGDSATPFKFRLADRGTETVIAVCNASKNRPGVSRPTSRRTGSRTSAITRRASPGRSPSRPGRRRPMPARSGWRRPNPRRPGHRPMERLPWTGPRFPRDCSRSAARPSVGRRSRSKSSRFQRDRASGPRVVEDVKHEQVLVRRPCHHAPHPPGLLRKA